MATFSNIGVSQPGASTITMVVASVTQDRGSTTEFQQLVTIGGGESTLEIGRVVNTTPDSSHYGLVVREAEPSTVTAVSSVSGAVITRSSAANSLHTIYQSSAADLNVTVAGYSTTVNISSGIIKVQHITSSGADMTTNVEPGSTSYALMVRTAGPVKAAQSSESDLLATMYQSTVGELKVVAYQSTASDLMASLPSSQQVVVNNLSTLVTVSPYNSTYISGVASSVESTLISSGNTVSVYSIDLSLPPTSSQTVRFVGASTNEKWRMYFHSTGLSAGVAKTVTPPQYIFRVPSSASMAITSSGGTANIHYSIGYYVT